MRCLSRYAQLYVGVTYILGLLSAIAAWRYCGPQAHADFREVSVYLVLAVLAGSKKVQLIRAKAYDQVGSMSLGFAITFAAILRFGPGFGVLIGGLSCLSGCLYPVVQPAYQWLFNLSLTATNTWICGWLFVCLNGGVLTLHASVSFPAVGVTTLVYFLLNTGGVTGIIALCSGQSPSELWRKTFLWTAPSYLAGASISTLSLIVFRRNLESVLLFGAPVAYLTYQFYAMYVDREERKERYIENLELSKSQLADLYLATIKSLALAIDAKDQHTHQHILRVQRYAMATAAQMNVTGADLDGLKTGALLHDIGKLGVPEYVLLKPGRLTEEEFAKIKKHPEIGAAILDPVEFPWPVLPVVKYHHEKWDGSGYPEGLKGEEIPLTARILAVADVYDALTSSRAYRHALTHERALETIREGAGKHFDPIVVNAFMQVADTVVHQIADQGYGTRAAQPLARHPDTSKADQAAREIRRASCELSALYEVAQTISCSMGLEETLVILLRKLQTILPGTACLFLLNDPESGSLRVRAAVGVNREYVEGSRTLSASSASLRVALLQTTYLGEYDPDDLMLTGSQTSLWVPLSSALIVPVVHEGDVLGTINLYHPEANAFSLHDRELIETIAERVAMAVYNGLLFDRTRNHAFTDPLTGLYNLRYLTQHVEQRCQHAADRSGPSGGLTALERYAVIEATMEKGGPRSRGGRRRQDNFALLCMDVDSFKPINDNFGHQKGDQVLCDLSRLFREVVREGDVVVRYGGDEFIVVLDGVGPADAHIMAGRLQEAVERYDPGLVHPRLGPLHLGVSVGSACYPADGGDCASLLSAADTRMYANKTERKLVQLADRTTRHAAVASCDPSPAIYLKEVS